MPPKKKTTPVEIKASIDRKRNALPASQVSQDTYGYVSPGLRTYREHPERLSVEQQDFWGNVERVRRERYNEPVEVTIPRTVQASGRVIPGYGRNNPASLMQTKGKANVLRQFDNPTQGLQAAEQQVRIDSQRGLTVEEFAYKYAPPEYNNPTENYIAFLQAQTGLKRNDPISRGSVYDLTDALARFESGTTVKREKETPGQQQRNQLFRGRGGGSSF